MGLTVHFDLQTRTKSAKVAKQLVEKMRQLAFSYPFQFVGEIKEYNNLEESRDWAAIKSAEYITYPWNNHISRRVSPLQFFTFTILVGDGCESLDIGLGMYPNSILVEYVPMKDQRFFTNNQFDYDVWRDYARSKRMEVLNYDVKCKDVKIKTHSRCWHYNGGFCKTEYANDPAYGGAENFVHCHTTVVDYLEKVNYIKGLEVEIDDEGEYGDYVSNGTPYKGTHDLGLLLKNVNASAAAIAALVGKLKDAYPEQVTAPITNYSNFEQLEFRGQDAIRNVLPDVSGE